MASVLFIIHTTLKENLPAEEPNILNIESVFGNPIEEDLKTAVDSPTSQIEGVNNGHNSIKNQKDCSKDELALTLSGVLERVNVKNAAWLLDDRLKQWQVMFTCRSGERCDYILNELIANGIGNNKQSSISIVPITVHFPSTLQDEDTQSTSSETSRHNKLVGFDELPPSDSSKSADLLQEKKKSQFLKSVKSRLTVAQVIDVVKSGSMLTFDYIALVLMASLIAAIGLLENSSVLLVASMLVSPLMGPILGGTFGIVIRYRYLWKMGIQNEMIGLLLCLICGFVFGLVSALIAGEWKNPTNEMISRGEWRVLYVGVMVAIPSGAGVALSVLGGNQGSLVGVAISASLLPPAVNAGMCWSFALVSALRGDGYNPEKLSLVGAISMALTLVNIFVIFIMGTIVLKIKEVAPKTGTSMTTSFWKHDIKLTRSYLRSTTSESDVNCLWKEWERLNGFEDDSLITLKGQQAHTAAQQFKQFVESAQNDQDFNGVTNFLPKRPNLNPLPKELTGKSRFSVTKAYIPSTTTFSENPRFTVRQLDEDMFGNVDPSIPLITTDTHQRKNATQSTV